MKQALAIALIVMGADCLFAQDRFKVTLGTGVGQYKMDDLKEFQHLQEAFFYAYELETIDNFPVYIYYDGEVSVRIHRIISIGLIYRFQSTGCKSSYSDYSGVSKVEQQVKANNAGLLVDFQLWKKNKMSLSGGTRFYYSWTDLKNKQYLRIYSVDDDLLNNTAELKSSSVMINPDITFSYEIFNRLSANLSAGYCIDFKGDLESESGQPLRNFAGETLQSDWSGFRIGLSASYKF